MTAFLHLLGADSVLGADVVVDDVLACNGVAGVHVVVAGKDALDATQVRRLGPALLAATGPATSPGLRDLAVLSGLQRLLRELLVQHGDVVVHAHGSHARTLASIVGAGLAVVVDDGDDRPGHRLLPLPKRICFTSHGDLDRALEAGLLPRRAALTTPGIDTAEAVVSDAVVVVDEVVEAVVSALRSVGLRPTSFLEPQATHARAVIVGPTARLRPALAVAAARGTPVFAIGVPWAEDLARCAAFSIVDADDTDVAALTQAALTATPRAPRKLARALGRTSRTKALIAFYEGLGPAPSLLPMGRPGRRRPRR